MSTNMCIDIYSLRLDDG